MALVALHKQPPGWKSPDDWQMTNLMLVFKIENCPDICFPIIAADSMTSLMIMYM